MWQPIVHRSLLTFEAMIYPRPFPRLAPLILALMPGLASAATGPPPPEGALNLAACHGFYTAVVEHSRLVATENDAARLRRDMLAAMMNALLAEQVENRSYKVALMQSRVRARSQMRNLFRNADFDSDPRRNRIAKGQIRRSLRACDSLMIGNRTAHS
ncbi:hypothetical protein GCM10022290_24200 [Sagittula marina]